ncbi:MAG: rhodanese-like domain-containing protein [Actinomycetota bacterium]
MKRAQVLAVVFGVAVVIVAIVALSSGTPTPGLIDNGDLSRLQEEGARIVDVRTAAEFTGAHIEGAENVPLSDLAAVADGWDRTAPVVVYCAVGDRSDSAAGMLQSMGFERVYDLGGGIAQWDGALAGGAAAATDAGVAPQVALSGLPILYEFYTDW